MTLKAAASWLVCKEICIPEDATLTVAARRSARRAPIRAVAERLRRGARAAAGAVALGGALSRCGAALDLYVAAPALAAAHPADARFLSARRPASIKGAAPQTVGFRQGRAGAAPDARQDDRPRWRRARRRAGADIRPTVRSRRSQVNALPGPVPAARRSTGADASGIALAGWRLLLRLSRRADPEPDAVRAADPGDEGAWRWRRMAGARPREAVRESLAYGAGAILSFVGLGGLLIALRAGGAGVGWGFQLQEPIVGGGLRAADVRRSASISPACSKSRHSAAATAWRARGGAAGAFFTGVLAVAVAAPCTAPFMAAALGFALTQPARRRARDLRRAGPGLCRCRSC